MASGRLIHRTTFSNEDLAELPIEARFLYIGLIVNADDEGRMKANPKALKALIFPLDDYQVAAVKEWRDSLANLGLIELYSVYGKEYLCHPNWEKFQPLRKDRVRPSDCPPPYDGQPVVNQMTAKCPPNLTEPNLTEPNLTEPKSESVDSPKVFSNDVKDAWNCIARNFPSIAQVREISGARQRHLRQRYSEKAFREGYVNALNAIPKYPFLLGMNDRGWRISFDWFIQNDTNWLKVLEGRYEQSKYANLTKAQKGNLDSMMRLNEKWKEEENAKTDLLAGHGSNTNSVPKLPHTA